MEERWLRRAAVCVFHLKICAHCHTCELNMCVMQNKTHEPKSKPKALERFPSWNTSWEVLPTKGKHKASLLHGSHRITVVQALRRRVITGLKLSLLKIKRRARRKLPGQALGRGVRYQTEAPNLSVNPQFPFVIQYHPTYTLLLY